MWIVHYVTERLMLNAFADGFTMSLYRTVMYGT